MKDWKNPWLVTVLGGAIASVVAAFVWQIILENRSNTHDDAQECIAVQFERSQIEKFNPSFQEFNISASSPRLLSKVVDCNEGVRTLSAGVSATHKRFQANFTNGSFELFVPKTNGRIEVYAGMCYSKSQSALFKAIVGPGTGRKANFEMASLGSNNPACTR